jgi:hypothetical protein
MCKIEARGDAEMVTKTQHFRTLTSGVSRGAWLVGLGLVGIIIAAVDTAAADPLKSCRSVTNGGNVLKILENQTYALCAVASCFVFNQVAYCRCDIKTGDSISAAFDYDSWE